VRRTVRLPFIDPSPTNAFSGRVSAPFGPQLQSATTRETEFVVCNQSIYHYFRKWRIDGTWERINRAIRERLRVRMKRDPQPSAGGEQRGYDGGKKVKGRKRHLLVELKASC
jgi:transposase